MPVEVFKVPAEAIDLEAFLPDTNTMRQEGQLVTTLKFAPFIRWIETDQKQCTEKRLSHLLLGAIESAVMLHCFPRGKYEIAVLILDNGGMAVDAVGLGDCLAAAITSIGLAMSDAGVQMYDIPVGVLVDLSSLNKQTDGQKSGELCAAVLPQLRQFSMLHSSNSRLTHCSQLRLVLNQAMEQGIRLAETIRQALTSQLEVETY